MALNGAMIEAARGVLLRESGGKRLTDRQITDATRDLMEAAIETGASPGAAAVQTRATMRQLVDGSGRVRVAESRPGGQITEVAPGGRTPIRESAAAMLMPTQQELMNMDSAELTDNLIACGYGPRGWRET